MVVTWDSNDGDLKIYVNGTLRLNQTVGQGMNIPGGGTLVLGQVSDKGSKCSHSFHIVSKSVVGDLVCMRIGVNGIVRAGSTTL